MTKDRYAEMDPYIKWDGNCPGYKYPKQCPHDGKYQDSSPHCKECVADADEAVKELNKLNKEDRQ